MSDPSPHIHALAREMMAADRPAAKDGDVVDAVERTFSQLDQLMCTLIGQAGFNAILARGAYLLLPRWPWLEAATLRSNASVVTVADVSAQRTAEATGKLTTTRFFVELRNVATDRGEAEVLEAATALLAHVLRLMTDFIGDELTLRLLRRVWVNLPNPEQK